MTTEGLKAEYRWENYIQIKPHFTYVVSGKTYITYVTIPQKGVSYIHDDGHTDPEFESHWVKPRKTWTNFASLGHQSPLFKNYIVPNDASNKRVRENIDLTNQVAPLLIYYLQIQLKYELEINWYKNP